MSVHGEPYIPASESPLELTVRVVVVGILLGILMTAANAYLGLYAGMTVSASIPAAVMSMIILRSLFKEVMLYKQWPVLVSHWLLESYLLYLLC